MHMTSSIKKLARLNNLPVRVYANVNSTGADAVLKYKSIIDTTPNASLGFYDLAVAGDAINDFVRLGVWDKVIDLGLFLGDNYEAATIKQKPILPTSWFCGDSTDVVDATFTYSRTQGISSSNGSVLGPADCTVANLPINCMMGIYMLEEAVGSSRYPMGILNTSANNARNTTIIGVNVSGNLIGSMWGPTGLSGFQGVVTSIVNVPTGLVVVNRTSPTNLDMLVNNTVVGTYTASVLKGTATIGVRVLGARGNSGPVGTISRRVGGYIISNGMTTDELTITNTIFQDVMRKMGRV